MVETLPENGAFMRAVSLEARILDSETEEIAVADKDWICPRGFHPSLSDGVAIHHTKNPGGTQMLATPDQQIWLTRPCADSNEGKPPLTSVQDRLSCNRCDACSLTRMLPERS